LRFAGSVGVWQAATRHKPKREVKRQKRKDIAKPQRQREDVEWCASVLCDGGIVVHARLGARVSVVIGERSVVCFLTS
jgi:hypothetical protein